MLWMGSAALLWGGGRSARRAATRGLIALGLTSALVNGPAKLVTRRARPVLDDVPIVRRLARLPTSTSFPSGHSASAFAFATGVGLEMPHLALPLVPLAGAVAVSRVYTGVHYPSDVVAGSLVGTFVAYATRSWWPVEPSRPLGSRAGERVETRPHPRGEGAVVVVNTTAGPALSRDLSESLEDALPQAEVRAIDEPNALGDALEDASPRAEVIGICGGDGSVNQAAQCALTRGKPLAVFPGGTLNHLARDLGLEHAKDAVEALEKGSTIAMDVGTVDGRIFLNTASLGLYPDLVAHREKLEGKIGKWPALTVALVRQLRRARSISVEIDGRRRRVWMIFVGNCKYHPSGFAPSWRERLDDAKLDVRIVDASSRFARTRLVASVLTGRLGRSRVYEQRLVDKLEVRSLEGPLKMALDGETFDGSEELTVAKKERALTVYASLG